MEPIQDLSSIFSNNNPGLGGSAKTELAAFFDPPPAARPNAPDRSAPRDIGAILAQEGAEHLKPVIEAIYQQESGAGANAGTSINGARGGMQILPDTFRRFAKAGERIDDPEDNARVGVRIIKNLARRFGDDPAKIAAGYFSGEGNVNPGDGDAWKADHADGNGKRVSGYVGDVLAKLTPAPGASGAAQPEPVLPDLAKAPKWVDIEAKPEFAALSPERQAVAKAAYFDHWIAPHAGHRPDLRAQFLAAKAAAPVAPDIPATGTADFMTDAVTPPQEREAPATPELPTTSRAPVRPEVRAVFQAQWDAATPEQRQAMQERQGWVGMLARERAGVFEPMDRAQEALPADNALIAVDPRAEFRRARLVAQGEAPEFAERAAREGARSGALPGGEVKALGDVTGTSDFDFDTKNLFDTKGRMTGFNNPLTRGVAKGVLGVGKAGVGYLEFLADATGIDGEAAVMHRAGAYLSGKEQAIGEHGDRLSRNLEGAISSIGQQLPLMIAGVKLGSMAIPLAGIALQTFGQEYSDGRRLGQSFAQATTRASLFAAFEVIGERFGLGQQMEALRAVAKGLPSDQIVGLLWSALKKEVPGEILTTTGQFAIDKFAPGGVGLAPGSTFGDYVNQVADTIGQTIMQSALMMGGTSGVSAGVRYAREAGRVTSDREAEIAKMKAIEKWERYGLAPQRSASTAPSAEVTPDGRIEPGLGAVLETETPDAPPVAPNTEITAGATAGTDPSAAPAAPPATGEIEPATGPPPSPPSATAETHPLSQAADEIIRDLALDAGLPLETVLPERVAPQPPAAGTPDTISDQDVQDFANGRFQQLRTKRDGQIETTVGETGLTDQDVPGAGLTAEEQHELDGLMQARGDAPALRVLYGLDQGQAGGGVGDIAAAPLATTPPRHEPQLAAPELEHDQDAPGVEPHAEAQQRPAPAEQQPALSNPQIASALVVEANQQFALKPNEAGRAFHAGIRDAVDGIESRRRPGGAYWDGHQWALGKLNATHPQGQGQAGPVAESASAIDAAAHEAATSPRNNTPDPTEAQKAAGNYQKGHVRFDGLDLTIENPAGSERTGADANGKPWSVKMTAHYGYLKRSEGADGEQVDVYLADNPSPTGRVFVFNQHDLDGNFDEHKAVVGVNTPEEAKAIYDAHFSDGTGPQRRRFMQVMPAAEFRAWAQSGDTSKPLARPARTESKARQQRASEVPAFFSARTPAERAWLLNASGMRQYTANTPWHRIAPEHQRALIAQWGDHTANTPQPSPQAQERSTGARAVAQRQVNAAERFVSSAVEQFGLTREEAGKAWDYYLKNGLVKVDAVGGQFDLQDGRLWDGEALRRAASLPPTKPKPRTEKEARVRRRQQLQQEILHGTQATQAQQAETQGPERQQAPPEPSGVGAVGADAASAREPAVAAPKTEREAREQRRQTDILTPDGKKVAARWDVVEADSIQASLKEGVSQPRDRGRAASDAQVQEIAGNPDFERLSDTSKTMDYGAPTLSADGLIVGGNGRFEGISRAYDGPAANAYRAALEKSAARFGLDGEVIRGMKKPVLVRRVTDRADTRQLAIQSNQAAGLQMSDMEQAALDAERMKSLELVEVSDTGDIPLTSRNMQAIKEALSGYSTNELAGMLTAEGGLSQSGIRRLRNAILFSAYGKSETLARLIESPDADMKNIGTALVRAAGKLSQVRGGIAHGGLPAEFDIAADLTAAIETLSGLRAAGERVDTFLAQGDMFGGGLSSSQRAIIKFLADNLRSARAITEGLAGYAERVLSAGNSRGGLFDDVPLPTKMEVWNDATKRFANERAAAQSQQSLFDQPAPGLLADTTGGHREVPAGEGNRPDADRQSGHEAAREPEAGRSADAGDRSKQEAERLSVADEGQHGQEAITGEAAKQPWQMTRESFVQAVRDGRDFKQLGVAPTSLSTLRGAKDYGRLDRQASDHHRAAVTTALVQGEQIPAEVLADYPDLQAAKASQPGEAVNSKDRFAVERVNQKTNEIETFVFERGEYVKAFMSHDRFDYGEITGISHARREAKVGDGDRWYGFGSIYKTGRPAEKPPAPTVPMSKVIEAANTKHGAELGAADRLYTRAEHAEFVKRLNAGEVTAEELKATYARFLANKDGIRSELNAKTVKELAPNGAGNLKKSEIVDHILGNMGDRFVVADGFAYSPFSETREQAQQRYVNAATDEQIREHAERVKKARADRAQAMEEKKKAAENPETLDDFKTYIEIKAGDTMTREQARMTLTPAQRATFDTLAAEQSREERKGRADQQRAEVRVAATTTEGQIVETKHTKTGEPLFVVKAAERVEREVYNHWNATAKKLGGWYSSFRGNGAVPGFQFKTRESADAFLAFIGGKAEQAKEAVQARRDAFEDDRSQTAVERLTEMADRLEARADESLAVERKANTHRRADMAARAEAAANADKALAKTMRNIAQAIASGKTKFLDRVRQKAQVEMLRGFLATAKANELRAKFPSYAEQEKHRGEAPSIETADYVAFPRYTAYRSDLATMGRQLLDIDGAKKVGAALLKVADDVSVAYQVFAQENLQKVASFKTRDGKPALFSSRADAEAAIARSGFKGKAIVLPFKRGQNLIIMSPRAAREAGVWSGDDDKRITLTADFGEEVVAKVKEFAKYRISMPYLFENVRAERARLKAIGIETAPELRAALREFMSLQAAAPEADKIKQMERAMIGRKNDGLDFFPTPAGVADAMVEAAGIKEGMAVLEPSAGMGHIAERIRAAGVEPDVVEMASDRRALLEAKGFNVVGADFLDIKRLDPLNAMGRRTLERELENAQQLVAKGGDRRLVEQAQERLDAAESGVEGYDRIIMNPPFSDRRDAAHVQHAFTLLKPGGRLVAIVGEGVFFGQDKKAQAFRAWLEEVGGTAEKLDEGTFLDPALPANTSANARMVVIDKGAQDGATMASRGAMADTPTTPEGLRTRFAERFPDLRKPLDEMLARGERGERGGLVIVTKAADLPAVFAEKTGAQLDDGATSSQDAAVQALYHAETGLTFLVGEYTDLAAVPGVVLHEVVHGEQGSELADKIDKRANEMLRLRRLARPAVRELLDQVAERLEQAGAATRENGRLVVNTPAEVAPYLIEEAARAGRRAGFSAADGKFLSWIDEHLGKSLGNLIRDVVAAIRASAARWGLLDPNKLAVDDLLAYAKAGMRRAAAGRSQGAGVRAQASHKDDASASMEYAKSGLQLLSFIDDPKGIFQYKKAGKDAQTMEAVAAALEQGLKVKPIDTQTITQGKADRAWAITMPDGHQVTVYEKNGRVWINAATLESGTSRGSLLYALVGNYAYNTGKVFAGDPDGLSPVALIRRTENMLSLAIKFGTTRFLYPHAAQVDPKGYYSAKTDIDSGAAAVAKEVQPLRWSDTDDEQNMRNLFLAAYNNAQMLAPEIAHVRYDFVARRFVAEDGSVVAESDFKKISDRAAADLGRRGLGALGAKNAILPGREGEGFIAGSATLKRAALFQSLVHGGRDERTWGRILDQIGEQLSGRGLDQRLNGILYSKAGWGFSSMAHQARRGVIQFFGNRQGSLKTFGAYDKTLATQYHKALKDRHYGKVFGYVNAMQSEVSLASIRPSELAPGILPRVDDVKSALKQMVRGKRGGKPLAQAAEALFAGTLAGANVLAGKVWTEPELRGKFELDDTGVALYKQARAAIDASLDEVAAAEAYAMAQGIVPKGMRRLVIDDPRQAEQMIVGELVKQIKVLDLAVKAATLKGNDAQAAELRAARAAYLDTKRKVEKIFVTADNLKNAGYAPLMRFGKYTVTVQVIDPSTGALLRDPDGNLLTEYFGKFETEAEARAVQREMEAQYAGQADIVVKSGVDSQTAHELYAGVSPETVALFGDAVGANEVTRKYYQMALSERSALKRRLERKGTAGFSDDLPRVLSTFITSNGRFAAQRYYLRDLNNAIKYIPQEKGDVKDEALKLKQFVMNPKDPGAPISSALFAWFLGGSIAAGTVNLTQPVMMTAPYLSQFGSITATKALVKALPYALGKRQITDATLRAALKRASQEGIVDAQEIFHLYTVGAQGVAAGLVNTLARIPGAGGMIKAGSEDARARVTAFMTLWGSMFSLAEGFNRRLTFLAAWDVAKVNNEPSPYGFAVRAVNETQGIYNKVNRPNWARGGAGRVILTFKQFSIMYVELLSRMWKRGGAEGKRAALVMLAVLMLAAGEEGLPFAQDLDDLIDTVGQLFGFDTNMRRNKRRLAYEILGKELGDLFLYGASAHLPLDFAGRLGLGNLIPGTGMVKLSNEQGRAREVAETLGPAAGMVVQFMDAYDAAAEGNPGKAVQNLAPKAVKDAMSAADMAKKGYATDTRGRKVVDVGLGDAAIKAVGFNPTKVAQVHRKAMPVQQDISLQKRTEASIVDLWARGIADDDDAMVKKAETRLEAWNRANPDTPIAIRAPQLRTRARTLATEKGDRVTRQAPREMRARVVDELAEED